MRKAVPFTAAAALFAVASFSLPLLAQSDDLSSRNSIEQQSWRETMHHVATPEIAGCFEAHFPSTAWEKVTCLPAPGYFSTRPLTRHTQTLGNGSDYVAEAPSGHYFSTVVGTWPTVSNVTSESTVNVPFGGGESSGITGKNEYTLQINSNFAHTAACKTYTKCLAWVQWVISTNTPVSLTSSQLTNDTEVFLEYWLIDYGSSSRASCPSGYLNAGADGEGPGVDCVQNSPATLIYKGQLPINDIASLSFSASAAAGGSDKAVATYGGTAYTATVSDSYTDIASGWSESEFNVVGNAGGAEAKFNTGASLTGKLGLTYGSTTTPTCLAPSAEAGTTGETNNLNAKSCSATGGSSPYIQFTESD